MVIYLKGGVCVCVCVWGGGGGGEGGGEQNKQGGVCVSGKKWGGSKGGKVGWNKYLKNNDCPFKSHLLFPIIYICITKYVTTNDLNKSTVH